MKPIKKQFARQLRKGQTDTEKRVWTLLKDRQLFGLKFRRQHVIEGFVVDFYCHEHQLAIEVDGGIHQRRREYDRLRQNEIEAKDVTIIRVSNDDLENNMCTLIQKIKEVIQP